MRARNGEIEIEYEVIGDGDDTFLLVNGLTSQLLSFPLDLCEMLAAEGFRVVRYDNRDVGLSTATEGRPPAPRALREALAAGDTSLVPYTLSDMAADGVAVLDEIGAPTAHVAGVSMGGMIVQTLAIEHASRIASATSIMSTPDPAIGPPTKEAWAALISTPPSEREPWIEHQVATSRVISGPHFDDADARSLHAAAYDRSYRPLAAGFQLAAVQASGSRVEALGAVRAPFQVVHGALDPLITPPGGEATAAAVPGSRLVVLDDMAHDLPRALWPRIVELLTSHARSAAA